MSIQLSGRMVALVAVPIWTVTSGVAQGQFLGLSAEEIQLDDAGAAMAGCPFVIRVYADFASPEDQLVGVVGSPSNPLYVALSGATFSDSANDLAGDRPPPLGALSVPMFDDVRYDSWFTVGNSSIDVGPAWPSGAPFTDEVIIAPGTSMEPFLDGATQWFGGPGGTTVAWTCPPSDDDPGDGSHAWTPQTVAGNWPDNRILFMQLAVEDDGDGAFAIEMQMGVLVFSNGQGHELPATGVFVMDPPSCPADVTGDGLVNTQDLAALIVGWGPCPTSGPCLDTNDDCLVNTQDLAAVIVAWGECP